jgi:hypothetical protein
MGEVLPVDELRRRAAVAETMSRSRDANSSLVAASMQAGAGALPL